MQVRIIEVRERHTGELLLGMPLYDFLKVLHVSSKASEEFGFEELRILIDGEELLPSECGHA